MVYQLDQDKGTVNKVSISGVLRYLGLSRSGYANYLRIYDTPSQQERRRHRLKSEIRYIHNKSKGIYGAPKICRELRKQGYTISEKTVGNYMRAMGLKACYIRPYSRTTINPDFDSRLKNLLQERYNPEAPNTIWCSDITYISTEKGFCYLTSIMDLYSRKIVSWRLSESLEAKWVVECVEEAKSTRLGANPLLIHTDRGSQYVSSIYLYALGQIQASYSQKASPWQNACIESFHALIKREWIHRFKIEDYDHAYRLIFEYINAFYHTVRIHSHYDYLSPNDYEAKYENLLKYRQKQTA